MLGRAWWEPTAGVVIILSWACVDTGLVAAKPRILTDHKDMIWSLIPLIAICAVIAVVSGNCSVGLTGGAGDDKTPAYDVTAGLTADAQTMTFPIRLPETPKDWKPNSGSRGGVDGKTVSNAGYITGDGVYMQLSQTDATEDSLVGYLSTGQVLGRGVAEVGGAQWVRYGADDGKSVWVTDTKDTRIALYSKANESDFRTLASAVTAAKVLTPRRDRPVPTG